MTEKTKQHRRHYSSQKKLEIVLAALEGSSSKASVAMRYGINANQVSRWVREYQRGEARWAPQKGPDLVPVRFRPKPSADVMDAGVPRVTTPDTINESSIVVTSKSGHQLTLVKPTLEQFKALMEVLL